MSLLKSFTHFASLSLLVILTATCTVQSATPAPQNHPTPTAALVQPVAVATPATFPLTIRLNTAQRSTPWMPRTHVITVRQHPMC